MEAECEEACRERDAYRLTLDEYEEQNKMSEIRLQRLEMLVRHLIDAVQEHGQIHREVERRNGYHGGFAHGLISDELEFIDLEVFAEAIEDNAETEDENESEEREA